MPACSQKSAECGEQHGYQMFNNKSLLYVYVLLRTLFWADFLIQLKPKYGFFALRHIPHVGEKFKTLTLKIGGLGAEILHKSIPIYNLY